MSGLILKKKAPGRRGLEAGPEKFEDMFFNSDPVGIQMQGEIELIYCKIYISLIPT